MILCMGDNGMTHVCPNDVCSCDILADPILPQWMLIIPDGCCKTIIVTMLAVSGYDVLNMHEALRRDEVRRK